MTLSTRSRFVSTSVFAISGIVAAFSAVTVASVLSANPKGPDASGQAVALIGCAALAGTCLTLAAGAATDAD
jgi:hypothetical protein